jgi:hypothetical protein
MALALGTLADGQLPNAKATLYTVPALKIAHVFIILANTDAPSGGSAYPVNIYVKRSGGTSRRILGRDTSIAAGASLELPDNLTGLKLSAGDIIEGDAGTAAKVDYLIYGGSQ